MPILTEDGPLNLSSRVVRIQGLPDFNGGNPAFMIKDVDGWDSAAKTDVVFVSNGGAPGAVASGDWLETEEYVTLSGCIFLPPDQQAPLRSALLAGLPARTDAPLIILGNAWDADKQVFVRRYDKPTIVRERTHLSFEIPLIMLDPYKYATAPQSGVMGVFTGETWYRSYADTGTAWVRAYANNAGTHVRDYQQSEPSGLYPPSLALTSEGDVASQRITFAVTGPLEAGAWWLLNEGTGRRLWAEIAITAGQTLVFDCHQKTAYLNGSDVGHLVFGDWLGLQPGTNTYRLVAGTQSDAFATVEALPAYL